MSRKQIEPLTFGAVYAAVRKGLRIGYTAFFKQLQKLDILRLVDLIWVQVSGGANKIVLWC